MRLNATCFAPRVSASGQAGNLTSISHADTPVDGTEAIGSVGALHTTVDAAILIKGVQASGAAQTISIETEVSIVGVEAQAQTESFRLPTLTKYPSLLFPSATIVHSSVRLFGVVAKGQADRLRCAKSVDVELIAVAA